MTQTVNASRLRGFLFDLAQLIDQTSEEDAILARGDHLLSDLIAVDDWLDPLFAKPDPVRYQQYLLYADPRERFSVVSFVWGPGQFTPIHNHTVWGLIGVLRGAERSQHYVRGADGQLTPGAVSHLGAGDVERVSPQIGDIHQVFNLLPDKTSISIHVYGGNIGAIRRSTFAGDGRPQDFISGYSNAHLPNIWDRSKE